MNKRGQIYILAAVVIVIAVYGAVKVTNKIEAPDIHDNFDFYVENFLGERTYVMDLGYLQNNDPNSYLTDNIQDSDNILNLFTSLGFNVGVVLITYDSIDTQNPWKIVNYLNQDVTTNCGDDCDEISLPSAKEDAGGLSFSLTGTGKNFFLSNINLNELDKGDRYFVKRYPTGNVNIYIDGNKYEFEKPKSDKVDSILFRNLNRDYVKVVKV